ncbi:MAG: hypothetical protein ACSW8A_11385 [Lachnospiraceae bacterium]
MIKRKRWIIAFLLLLTLCWQIETSADAACKQFMGNSGNNSCYSRLSELDPDFCSEFDEVDEYNVSIFSCLGDAVLVDLIQGRWGILNWRGGTR